MYCQRYNIFNHLYWLSTQNTNYNDNNLIHSYNEFLIKNKKTDT